MTSVKGLRVWDAALAFETEVIALVATARRADPAERRAQLCRAANSVGANIAEGFGRASGRERLHFLHIARGSLQEAQHHLGSSARSGLLPRERCRSLQTRATVIGRMLTALILRLERS